MCDREQGGITEKEGEGTAEGGGGVKWWRWKERNINGDGGRGGLQGYKGFGSLN